MHRLDYLVYYVATWTIYSKFVKNYRPLLISFIISQVLTGHAAALAERDSLDKPLRSENMKGPGAHVHEYDDIVSPDMETARSVANRARVSLKNGNVSRALALAQRAMKMDDDDMDIHLIYAQALEAKVERQTERDPYLYKKCLSEWIKVYRNEVGMEKGMTFKGLNLMGNMYNDDEFGNLAKKHLIKLTGYAPKLWETDNHFITRVTKEVETSVSGKIKTGASADEASEEGAAVLVKPRRARAPQD
ncbi:MAG: hypothetical protein JSS86_17140 [Cyanobacteria bacterium SZAS LIN-2]|nr:hypothetical protein [Cyanobacteria bacterium SZAS LIN-2]